MSVNSPSNITTLIRPRQYKYDHHSRRSADLYYLRPLRRATTSSSPAVNLHMALFNTRSLNGKTFLLHDFITTHDLDFLFLTETWVSAGDSTSFSELLPTDRSFFSTPRTTSKGGGTASIYKNKFHCSLIQPLATYTSFEFHTFDLRMSSPVFCAVIYRPPKSKDFINEFADFLSRTMINYDFCIITGDFNIHVCCESKPLVNDFRNLIDSFSLTQSVSNPTHEKGHILDLILTKGLSVTIDDICTPPCPSDHFPILFNSLIPCSIPKPIDHAHLTRAINPLTAPQFSCMFTNSMPIVMDENHTLTADTLLSNFNLTCTQILDTIAPLRKKRTKALSEPWLNDTTKDLRRACRRAERLWKKDNLHVNLEILRDCLLKYQLAVKSAKSAFISNTVAKNSHKPQVLFNIFNSLINPRESSPLTPSLTLCDNFQTFFIDKISDLRSQHIFTAEPPAPPLCTATFDHFEQISLSSLSDIVSHLRPTNCPTDSIPSRLLKEVFCSVGPTLVSLINACLVSGHVPASFKHAVVHPLIKKNTLDPSILSNFRPISQLPFLSKVLEKVVYAQLQSFLTNHGLHEQFQSGFKPGHSTETALLKVFNDLILTVDSGTPAILVLLDLSAAFDTVDHRILLTRLENLVGISGTALAWLRSYLTDRTFSVQLGEFTSSAAPLTCGVPQGSILAPLLFLLYMLPLGPILSKHKIAFHCYADDVQIYMPLTSNNNNTFQPLINCLDEIKTWMDANFLHLNSNKTEIIIFGNHPTSPTNTLGPLTSNIHTNAKNLGIIFDNNFKFDKQISSTVKTSFFHLRLLAKIKPYLPPKQFEMVIHSFITSRLDYCNALYYGLDCASLRRLQLVQNAAARLLTGIKKSDHITPILISLHWLPVKYRIDFKILLFAFKSINGLAPLYLANLVKRYNPPRDLRSADQSLLTTPTSKTLKTRGDRSFQVAAPELWNNLPLKVRSAQSIEVFKSLLKTHLFSLAFNNTLP